MQAEIISVGSELLYGDTLNTNAFYLSRELNLIGINVQYHTSVGDDRCRLKEVIRIAMNRCNLLIFTGGLGPTDDDLTKETVAEELNLELKIHEASKGILLAYFKERNRTMPEKNLKQVMFPEDCVILKNPNGSAPGCLIRKDEHLFALLPGPPREMIPMFENELRPFLAANEDHVIQSHQFNVSGIGESLLESMISDLIFPGSNPVVATYAGNCDVKVRVTSQAESQEEALHLIEQASAIIRERLGVHIYSECNQSLEEVVMLLLKKNGLSISCAESYTGGLIAGRLVNVPGISQYFSMGIITYSNESKKDFLGVSEESLKRYGAVSSQVAEEMAKGIALKANSHIGLSSTGIAGPDGGSAEKPVGLGYIGVCLNGKVSSIRLQGGGSRYSVRERAVQEALDYVRRCILESGAGDH